MKQAFGLLLSPGDESRALPWAGMTDAVGVQHGLGVEPGT
jgi:hypothetical protein